MLGNRELGFALLRCVCSYDIAPTIYDVVGITAPRVVHGVPQDPIDGVSFVYAFDAVAAPGTSAHAVLRGHGQPRHLHDGWMASVFGPRPLTKSRTMIATNPTTSRC